MAKGNKEEVKFASNGSLEKSEKDEESLKLENKSKHKRKGSASGSEQEEDGKEASETGDSVVVQIEEDAPPTDAADGKVSQKQANTYAAKKTVAQGMMDIALITANANQLRYLVEFNKHSSTFYVNVFLIILSLFLQVGVGLSLIFKGGLDLKVGVFLVTIINVFVASFTVTGTTNGGKGE